MLTIRKIFRNVHNRHGANLNTNTTKNQCDLETIRTLAATRENNGGPGVKVIDQFIGLVRQGHISIAHAKHCLERGIEIDKKDLDGGVRLEQG